MSNHHKKITPSKLLHKYFTNSAIKSAAYIEMLEDTRYLIDNNWLDDDKKQVRLFNKSCHYGIKDHSKTLNKDNIKHFQVAVNQYLSSGGRLYDDLTELEQFAMRNLYYNR